VHAGEKGIHICQQDLSLHALTPNTRLIVLYNKLMFLTRGMKRRQTGMVAGCSFPSRFDMGLAERAHLNNHNHVILSPATCPVDKNNSAAT
jgi:hypothetical protein